MSTNNVNITCKRTGILTFACGFEEKQEHWGLRGPLLVARGPFRQPLGRIVFFFRVS